MRYQKEHRKKGHFILGEWKFNVVEKLYSIIWLQQIIYDACNGK